MRIFLAFLVGLFMVGGSFSPAQTATTPDPTFHLYVLMGQSNMAGRGAVTPADRAIHPRVFTLGAEGRFRFATDPLHFDKRSAGVGPGLTFGRLLADLDQDITIGLLPTAVGGSALAQWKPGVVHPGTKIAPYDAMLARVREGKKVGVLRGVLWHQGESDLKNAEAYGEELARFFERLRDDLEAPHLPIVIGTLGSFWESRNANARTLNEQIRTLARTTPNIAVVETRDLTPKADGQHFDAASARELGRRFAFAMEDLQRSTNQTSPLCRPLWSGAMPIKALVDREQQGPNERGIISDVVTPTLTVYLPTTPSNESRAAVLVCPGGGYGVLASHHEGIEVARWLNDLGMVAVVLHYRLEEYGHPAPMLDAQRGLRWLRSRAPALGVDPHRIGVLGFSAGGHLASTVATHFDEGRAEAPDCVDHVSCRPDFAILVYPVITFEGKAAHRGSARNLLGSAPDPSWVTYYSNERHVGPQTPPTLLVHSRDDRAVPLANSELFRDALESAGVPCELLIYEQGGHGYGLGRKDQDNAAWPTAAASWLRTQKILVP